MTREVSKRIIGALLFTGVMFCALFVWLAFAKGQSLPRWPQNTAIRIVATSDRAQVAKAVEAWRPYSPVAIELGETGNVTILREKVPHEGQCQLTIVNGEIVSAVVRIDPSLKGEDFTLAVEHELGHVLGLQHRAGSIMSQPYVRTVKVAGLITVARIVWHPNAGDKNELEKLYAEQVEAESNIASDSTQPESVKEETALGVPTTELAVRRYAFHRKVTRGSKTRESDFSWADNGRLVETNIKGNAIKVPQFPVGEHVGEEWWARLSKSWSVTWKTGAAVTEKGDEGLEFPINAVSVDGKTRVEMTYRLHRVDVSVTPIE